MSFTDLTYLLGFLPVCLIAYKPVSKTKWANLFLLIASFVFYAWGSLTSFAVLIMVLLWNYMQAILIARTEDAPARKRQLIFGAAVNLLVLCFYRYLPMLGFLDNSLPLRLGDLSARMPLGLSFYIFSCLSCLFDVYRKDAPVPDSFVDFGIYAAFFGRVNMGPIGHYAEFEKQLNNHPQTRASRENGMRLFLQGLFRKVVLADSLALIFAAMAGNASWLGNLLYGFAYFFELYFDFSGYSRMARGTASMFGFEIPRNFDLPYTALSNQDFWRRWHISLTSWFRRYVYIPLGGNRVDQKRWIFNILCVWLLTGIWHGAAWTFLIWGLYQSGLILFEKLVLKGSMDRWPVFVRHAAVIICQLAGWTLFCSASLGSALTVIGRYIGIGVNGFADAGALFVFKESIGLLAVSVVLSSGLSEKWASWISRRLKGYRVPAMVLGYVLVFLICLCLLVTQSAQTFLYAVF